MVYAIIMRNNLIRCSDFEHALLERAREELAKKGVDKLSNLNPICPQCGKPMEGFKITYEHAHCSSCGYREDNVAITAVGAFALGVIVALGATALINMLSGDD